MVRFLLEAGADQEHKTDEMHTALMEASMDGHVEVARLLLDSGAQVKINILLRIFCSKCHVTALPWLHLLLKTDAIFFKFKKII